MSEGGTELLERPMHEATDTSSYEKAVSDADKKLFAEAGVQDPIKSLLKICKDPEKTPDGALTEATKSQIASARQRIDELAAGEDDDPREDVLEAVNNLIGKTTINEQPLQEVLLQIETEEREKEEENDEVLALAKEGDFAGAQEKIGLGSKEDAAHLALQLAMEKNPELRTKENLGYVKENFARQGLTKEVVAQQLKGSQFTQAEQDAILENYEPVAKDPEKDDSVDESDVAKSEEVIKSLDHAEKELHNLPHSSEVSFRDRYTYLRQKLTDFNQRFNERPEKIAKGIGKALLTALFLLFVILVAEMNLIHKISGKK